MGTLAADECPSGSLGGYVYEYGEILVISEKDENSENIVLSKKKQKAAEKAVRKAKKETEKAAKEKEDITYEMYNLKAILCALFTIILRF